MKTKYIPIELDLESLDHHFIEGLYAYNYKLTTNDRLPENKVFIKVEEPETIKEFISLHDISKQDVIDFLNDNYKK